MSRTPKKTTKDDKLPPLLPASPTREPADFALDLADGNDLSGALEAFALQLELSGMRVVKHSAGSSAFHQPMDIPKPHIAAKRSDADR
jgi:hypothetical protein